jgi:F-type H+-transporting ATPase subunit alpha
MVPIGAASAADRRPADGKTAVTIDAIPDQKDTGVICIYNAIGQAVDRRAVVRTLEEADALRYAMIAAPRRRPTRAAAHVARSRPTPGE